MNLVVGLTGGIGSGKSTVAELFAAHGVPVTDADVLSRQLTSAPGPALERIREQFGPDYLTAEGALDRARMRARVFSDATARAQLEALLHPLILEGCRDALARHRDAPWQLLVVPLLVEQPTFRDLVQRVLLVDCEESQQIERVMLRSGMGRSEVLAIMRTQLTREQRLANADDVIENTASRDDLALQISRLNRRYLEISN